MKPQLFLQPRVAMVVRTPRLGPPLGAALCGFALTSFLGWMATWAVSGTSPAWLGPVCRAGFYPWEFRLFVVILGLAGGVVGLITALGYSGLAWSFLGMRLGLQPARESEGPCTVVEGGPDLWALRLDFAREDVPEISAPTADRRLFERELPRPATSILFPCDEAAAASICRLFDPGERLLLRWVDPPLSVSGPLLLEIRKRQAMPASIRLPEESELDRAA